MDGKDSNERVLAGAKRVYAKLWVPGRQEVSMNAMRQSSSEIEGFSASGESSRSYLTPHREAKGVKLNDVEETPLHLAARHYRADAAKCLLDSGSDANARDRLNRTPLHLAIGADALDVFRILLRFRATDLEARMVDGATPLILAARHNLLDIVRQLIKAGVKINNADNQGKTALHWAASVNGLEVTKELLRNGAQKDTQDQKGQTPLFLGSREGNIETVRCLLVNCANRKLADSIDTTPEDIAKLRHHHDVVELLTDWSLECNTPTGSSVNSNNAKRKRKKARQNEEPYQ